MSDFARDIARSVMLRFLEKIERPDADLLLAMQNAHDERKTMRAVWLAAIQVWRQRLQA